MKWNNLKRMECPKCGDKIAPSGMGFRCSFGKHTSAQCPFYISSAKFDSVVNSLYKPRAQFTSPEDNLSALNNFGHKEYSKDYSDEIENL